MDSNRFKEGPRGLLASVLQWAGWWVAFGLLVFGGYDYGNRSVTPPVWLGLATVLSVGVAIAAGQARSRMRLTRVITEVFRVGLGIGDVRVVIERQQREQAALQPPMDSDTFDT